jgi:periplasmic divalent cation tolerance protein
MPEDILIALSTFPDKETARRVSHQLVTERFAACANVIPEVESIYRWKGKVETAAECLVLFKLGKKRQSAFQERLRSLHPYEVPEILFLGVEAGLTDYLRWVAESCGS